MLQSMTGFGKSAVETENYRIRVEIRCLNSRNMDIILKLPAPFREFEYDLRSRVSEILLRGKADVWIMADALRTENGGRLNMPIAVSLYNELLQFARQTGAPTEGILESVMRQPDVFKTDDTTASEADANALRRALDEALEQVKAFRFQEGKHLEEDILLRIDNIAAGKEAVKPFEQPRIERMRRRLQENIHATLNLDGMDANRFEEELIYYMEKLDITEEKVRLQGHLNYFGEIVRGTTPDAGRKLGFLAQEIGREINTIGSKANDADIQKVVVGMKDELEKIKEQLLNIL